MRSDKQSYGAVLREKMKDEIEEPFTPLNRRQAKDRALVIWILVIFLISVLAVIVFDKIEGIARLRWPNL